MPQNGGDAVLSGRLEIKERVLKQDAQFGVDIRVDDLGGRADLYNPSWNGLLALPGEVALYDRAMHYVGDMDRSILVAPGSTTPPNMPRYSEMWSGSRRRAGSYDWGTIFAHSYMGTTVTVHMPAVLPGLYHVQVIYFKSLTALAPVEGQTSTPHSALDERSELFRSNVVDVTVVANT